MRIGAYRGFALSAYFDDFQHRPFLTLNGALSYRVELGNDPKGSLVRLDNELGRIAERAAAARNQLENLRKQEAASREELEKPFPYENELAEKTARLTMLDMRLNLDNATEFQPEQTLEKKYAVPAMELPPVWFVRTEKRKKARSGTIIPLCGLSVKLKFYQQFIFFANFLVIDLGASLAPRLANFTKAP